MRSSWGSSSRNAETPAVYVLLAAFGVLFLIDFYMRNAVGPLLVWPISVEWLKSLQLWRPFTFPFVHGSNFWYLITDALVLYFFGSSLERAWGTGRFLFFFFASGIVAGLVVFVLGLFGGSDSLALVPTFFGMVGSLMSIVIAFAAMNPFATVLLYFFPIQARWLGVLAVAFELFGRSGFYGGPVKALVAVGVTALFAYSFTVSRFSLNTLFRRRGPSLKEHLDRWQQRRRMRQWQRKVSRIERPDDLFKKDK
ncbi:MAG: rhomboid family intramembrane serine protease [Candidatus Eremiobacteraeota bacterium]|nr:rhomboid family intramembrane serine protease [Candidatus Eremiobacteraeota bacterium]